MYLLLTRFLNCENMDTLTGLSACPPDLSVFSVAASAPIPLCHPAPPLPCLLHSHHLRAEAFSSYWLSETRFPQQFVFLSSPCKSVPITLGLLTALMLSKQVEWKLKTQIPVLLLYPLGQRLSLGSLGQGNAVLWVSQSWLLPSHLPGCYQNDLSKWKCYLLAQSLMTPLCPSRFPGPLGTLMALFWPSTMLASTN